MKRLVHLLILCSLISVSLIQCTKKGKAIVEPRFGTYKFTTYTVDTFRFRVLINEEVVSDSLLSPQSSISKQVNFSDTTGRVKIIDAKNSQVILDSAITMKIGTTTISIVQFSSGETPFIPPTPNEPAPLAGNTKVRFQYLRPQRDTVPFLDSIKCFVWVSTNTSSAIDTIVLKQNEVSGFYEVTLGNTLKMAPVFNAETGVQADNTTPNLGTSSFTDFNTVSVRAINSRADYRLTRIY